VDSQNKSLFAAHSLEAPCDLASALAPPATKGHFDELRGLQNPLQSQTQSLGCAGWTFIFPGV